MTTAAAIRAYRLVLRLYPAAFRRQFGAEMLQTFKDHRADIETGGGRAGRAFWLAVVADEARNIVRQHGAAVQGRMRLPRPTGASLTVAVILFPPLFGALLMATVGLAASIPHPPVSGLLVLAGMGALVMVPALFAAVASFFLGSGLVALGRRRRRT